LTSSPWILVLTMMATSGIGLVRGHLCFKTHLVRQYSTMSYLLVCHWFTSICMYMYRRYGRYTYLGHVCIREWHIYKNWPHYSPSTQLAFLELRWTLIDILFCTRKIRTGLYQMESGPLYQIESGPMWHCMFLHCNFMLAR
jgi:hypothetical protein